MADESVHDSEDWRPVSGYEGIYEVSPVGQIRRVAPHPYRPTPFLIKAQITSGYLSVLLRKNGKRARVLVHRAVALAFLGPSPTPRHEVAHNDGNSVNAAASNLRWATPRENQMDKHLHGTMPVQQGERNYAAKLHDADVVDIRRLAAAGLLQRQIAVRFGVNRSLVSMILNGRRWSHVEKTDADAA